MQSLLHLSFFLTSIPTGYNKRLSIIPPSSSKNTLFYPPEYCPNTGHTAILMQTPCTGHLLTPNTLYKDFPAIYTQTLYNEKAVFSRLTENSILDKIQFKKLLSEVRKQGYAQDDEEYAIGIGCLAVPIFDHTNNCIASLGLTGDYHYYADKQTFQMFLDQLKKTAHRISVQMGANLSMIS